MFAFFDAMKGRLYGVFRRIVPFDATRVLLWDIRHVGTSTPGLELVFATLSAAELKGLPGNPAYEFNTETVQDVERREAVCFGAYSNGVLAAYLHTCKSPVSARKNSGGIRFAGIGLEFPADVRYVYKVLVLPEYRGRRLAQHLLHFSANELKAQGINFTVTTTNWKNKPFLRTAERIGFTRIATAVEIIVAGMHFYKAPQGMVIDSGSGACVSCKRPDGNRHDIT